MAISELDGVQLGLKSGRILTSATTIAKNAFVNRENIPRG